VQRCALNRRAGQLDRIEIRDGRDRAELAHLEAD
jgi:hypothetical protein